MISIGGPWPTAWSSYLRGWGGTQGGERGSRHFLATEKMARHTASGRALSLAGHTAFDSVAPRVEAAVRAADLGFRRADWGARAGPFPGALLGGAEGRHSASGKAGRSLPFRVQKALFDRLVLNNLVWSF